MKTPTPQTNATISCRKSTLTLTVLAVAISVCTGAAFASSHREAPAITQSPKVDATDLYMFRSTEPGRSAFVTIIANYYPGQSPAGGPNFYQLDATALYAINIDNSGDGKADWTFQFAFQNSLADNKVMVGGKSISIPLVTNGAKPVNSPFDGALNVRETFNIAAFRAPNTWKLLTNAANNGSFFDKPVDNIGNKTIPDYKAYAARHVYSVNVPDCATPGRVFVGQRKDTFVVNLGETFDLLNFKFPAVEFDANAERTGQDALADKNVTTFAMELPIACLTSGTDPVIGAWTTALVRETRTSLAVPASGLNATAAYTGGYIQTSRLGMPLVNELVIGLKDKDKFNASLPSDDAQFADYVTNPSFPAIVQTLFAAQGVKAPTNFPRLDLVSTFLTGITGANKPLNGVPSEMLRLNTTSPVVPQGSQNRLGVIGGDNSGFPNGRRLGDDVVDISLRVIMGKLCTLNMGCGPADAASGAIRFTDGAFVDDSFFDVAFPYAKTPLPGSPNVGAKSTVAK